MWCQVSINYFTVGVDIDPFSIFFLLHLSLSTGKGFFVVVYIRDYFITVFIYESFFTSFWKVNAHATLNGKHGFINEKGETIIPFEYDWAGNVNEGFVNVKKDNLWGHLNKEGKVTTPFEYEKTGDFNKGVSNVKKNGKSGRVNTEGKLILPCKYDGINGIYADGRMLVSLLFWFAPEWFE